MEHLKELCSSAGNFSSTLISDDYHLDGNITKDYLFSSLGAVDWSYACGNGNKTFSLESSWIKTVLKALNIYFTPVIILVGCIGNLLAFLVFTLTHLRRQSSSIYLASLAIVDTTFLLTLTVMWLGQIQVPLIQTVGVCQCVVYLSYVTTFLSVWYVGSFTIERYIIVLYPLRKDRYCTPAHAKRVVLSLAVTSLLLYSFVTFTTGVVEINSLKVCSPLHPFYSLLTVTELLHSSVTLLVPSVIIVLLNVRIVIRIVRFSKKHKGLGGPSRQTLKSMLSDTHYTDERFEGRDICSSYSKVNSDGSFFFSQHRAPCTAARFSQGSRMRNNAALIRISHSRTRAQYRTARMLIIVSSVFVLLNLPSHVIRIHTFVAKSMNDRYLTEEKVLRWQELFQLLYHLNFSINFFLYSVYGRQFRSGLRALASRFLYKIRRMHNHIHALMAFHVQEDEDVHT